MVKYVGDWKDGAAHGHYTWTSGEFQYIGEWKDGTAHGLICNGDICRGMEG